MPEDYFAHNDICIETKYEQDILISEFKNKILNNISEYINSTQVINGTNFVGIFLSSDKMNPEEQTKYGISAIDFGYCIKIIKKHYNISESESVLVLNIETKDINNNNNSKAFYLRKYSQVEIYNMSGTELDISVCKEDRYNINEVYR